MNTETIKEMRHAIGLDYKSPWRGKYQAWRNYCQYNKPSKIWDDLITQGYAKVCVMGNEQVLHEKIYWYSLTKAGLDLVGEMIGAKITERK